MFPIETERLRLRVFRPEDLERYHATIYGVASVMVYLPGGLPVPIERTETLLEHFIDHHDRHGYSIWAVTDKRDDTFYGHGGLIRVGDSESVELAYAFGERYWGMGLATEVARASLGYGFEEVGLDTIVALAYEANTPSQRVMQKIGMAYRGLTSHYHGTELVLYEIRKRDYSAT